MIYIACQLLTLWIAWQNAIEEAAWSLPFRSIPFDGKYDLLKITHRAGLRASIGWALGFAIACGVFTGYTLWLTVACVAIAGFTFGFLYWAAFDPIYGYFIGKGIGYLGDTARTDVWVTKHFGANGGRKKMYLCLVIVAVLNAAWLLIYFLNHKK
jgi:hypothetical protein